MHSEKAQRLILGLFFVNLSVSKILHRIGKVMGTIAKVGFSIILFLILSLAWASIIEPRWLDVTTHQVSIKNLSAEWKDQEIAFISDFQIGMWLGNESTVTKAVDEIIKRKPAAVLIGGDFIYHPTDDEKDEAKDDWQKDDQERTKGLIQQVVKLLVPLRDNNIKVFAVLGNHDYSMGHQSARMIQESADLLISGLQSIGIEILHNESAKISLNNEDLYIVGVAPFYPKMSNVQKALEGVGEQPNFLFMHNANALDKFSGDEFDLAVAGHTHGGQIRIPGFPSWSWTSLVPQSPDEVKGDSWIPDYKGDNRKLYVNRGIGFSNFPLRLNCRPELTFFRIN